MIRKVSYESQERREAQVLAALNAEGIKSVEEANQICDEAGVDPYLMCEETQRICFENAKWAYVCGAAIAIKRGCKTAADCAEAIGVVLVPCRKGQVLCQTTHDPCSLLTVVHLIVNTDLPCTAQFI